MEKKHIIQKYNKAKLWAELEATKHSHSNTNCYVCENPECKKLTKTIDVHPGVTPFIHRCHYCGGTAQSTMYRDIAPDQYPVGQWYRPSIEEVLKHKKNAAYLDHVLYGRPGV
jgi:hypothetical protein